MSNPKPQLPADLEWLLDPGSSLDQPEAYSPNGSVRTLLGSIEGVLEGFADALADYFRREDVRVALLVHVAGEGVFLCGSRSLLRGHEPLLLDILRQWRDSDQNSFFRAGWAETDLLQRVNGLPRFSAWFVETPPNLCTPDPLHVWLSDADETTSAMISRWENAYQSAREEDDSDVGVVSPTYSSDSRRIAGFATEAICESLRDAHFDAQGGSLNVGNLSAVPNFLDAVQRISTTLEEGSLARGKLCLVLGPELHDLPYAARFAEGEEPELGHTKHARKLLATASEGGSLVTDGYVLYGVANEVPLDTSILAEFRGRVGEIVFQDRVICTLSAGRFFGTHFGPDWGDLSSALKLSGLGVRLGPAAVEQALRLLEAAVQRGHGCSLVLDGRSKATPLSGQALAEALDLGSPEGISLACAMSGVDGALHLNRRGQIVAFGCLLDGMRRDQEDLASGARHNSALRFSAAHDNVGVMVASQDGYISVFVGGVDLLAGPNLAEDESVLRPSPRLSDWFGDR